MSTASGHEGQNCCGIIIYLFLKTTLNLKSSRKRKAILCYNINMDDRVPLSPAQQGGPLYGNARAGGQNKAFDFIKGFWPSGLTFVLVFFIILLIIFYRPDASRNQIVNLVPGSEMPYLGAAEAPIIVIEAADPLCVGCDLFFRNIEKELRNGYIDRGLVKFYHWPTFSAETQEDAFDAFYCANEQDKYWKYRDYVVNIPRSAKAILQPTKDEYKSFAQKTGLDAKKFGECFEANKYSEILAKKNKEIMKNKLNSGNVNILVDGFYLFSPSFADLSAQIRKSMTVKGIND
ncbi:MAG: hypothetical protein UT82_C0016G0006 [Parcubacteria group bacterium GW2011_GWB1_40_14]|nr:MAG: hypothetical protein UT82_C0016G0006 [Parcubacteria group bacterium GW2011_GWB1_40_14]